MQPSSPRTAQLSPPAKYAGGFTLVEVMIALFIFAIIGLISSQLLSQSLSAQEKLQDRGERLANIHRSMTIIQRDLLQFTPRSIRNENGDTMPSLIISNEGFLELTRLGWRNPLQHPRSTVQRVSYRWQDNSLLRAYWYVLDRDYAAEPAFQTLLDDVERVEFYVLDRSNNEHKFWPSASANANANAIGSTTGNGANPISATGDASTANDGIGSTADINQPPTSQDVVALILRIEIAPFGVIERIWEVPSV